jgi:hypothetical protein
MSSQHHGSTRSTRTTISVISTSTPRLCLYPCTSASAPATGAVVTLVLTGLAHPALPHFSCSVSTAAHQSCLQTTQPKHTLHEPKHMQGSGLAAIAAHANDPPLQHSNKSAYSNHNEGLELAAIDRLLQLCDKSLRPRDKEGSDFATTLGHGDGLALEMALLCSTFANTRSPRASSFLCPQPLQHFEMRTPCRHDSNICSLRHVKLPSRPNKE